MLCVQCILQAQLELDEKSADSLWDLSEEFRLAAEDRESVYAQACQLLRASVDSSSLQVTRCQWCSINIWILTDRYSTLPILALIIGERCSFLFLSTITI